MVGKKPGPAKGATYKRRKSLIEKRCEVCGKKFKGLLKRGRFCTTRCRDVAAKRRQRGSG